MSIAQALVSVAGAIIGSGALFGFFQFLIARKDKREERIYILEKDQLMEEVDTKIDEHRKNWKETYCDKNLQDLHELRDEYKRDFSIVREAIEKLTENDITMGENIKKLTEQQDSMIELQKNVANCLVGQTHHRIIDITDHITERGSITNKEKATIKSMYEPYRKLGGNGEVKEAVEYVVKLPTISDEEAREKDYILKGKDYMEMRKSYEELKASGDL